MTTLRLVHFSAAMVSALLSWTAVADPAPPQLREVVIVFKTHFDIGYTDMASNVVQRYRTTMIDEALAVVDRNRTLPESQRFAWTLAGWPLARILEDWPGQNPQRQQHVQGAFKEGRFVVHALPFTTHTELLEPEDLVRGLGYSSRLSRDAGLPLPRDAKMTDVPSHSWLVPTLLRHAGVEFLHLGCNAASRSPEVPVLFWWEGPDGSRILTMYTAESYGTGIVPPADWPYATWLALIHTGDNHGPPTPDEVQQLLDQASVKLPGVKVRIGRLSDFSDALLRTKPNIPVVRGDMPDTWIHGPMSDPIGARLARNVRPQIAMAESLSTLLPLWGLKTPPAASQLAKAYEQSLLYGEHTWGGALYWVSQYTGGRSLDYGPTWQHQRAEGKFARLEASWAEHTSYIEEVNRIVQPLLEQQLNSLAGAVKLDGRRVIVFNPLPWKRSGLVSFPDQGPGPLVARAPGDASGERAPLTEGRREFLARDVPAMGYRTFTLSPETEPSPEEPLRQTGAELENAFFSVSLDSERGTIRSMVDRRSGRELVDGSAARGFGQFVYERFSADDAARFVRDYVKIDAAWATNELGKPNLPPASQVPYQARSPVRWSTRVERQPDRSIATMCAAAGDGMPAITTRVSLHRALPYVELEITVHDKAADPWPEAGWIALPFRIPDPRYRLGRLGSIVDPAKDVVPGCNQHLLALNTGLAISDAKGTGVGLCALDSPLVSLGEPGCWKYSRAFTPRKPTVYVNLFNNQWTTNFRLWNEGSWTARVRIWSFDHFDPEPSLMTPALESRYAMQAAVSEASGGMLPVTQSGLTLSRKGILVTALGTDPDGTDRLIRLWELSGRAGPVQVQLPARLRAERVLPVDLRGRPVGAPILVEAGGFELNIGAFAPATFVIHAAPEIP